MSNPLIDIAGVIFGIACFVLAFVMLVSEHRGAPRWHRFSVAGIGFLGLMLACNSSVSFRSIYFDLSPSPVAVLFAMFCSFNWAYRLWRR